MLVLAGGIYGTRYAVYKFLKDHLGYVTLDYSIDKDELDNILKSGDYNEDGQMMELYTDYDLHTHTIYSDGRTGATVDNYLEIARKFGLKTIGFSDHFWDDNVPGISSWYANQLTIDKLTQLRTDIANADTSGMNVLAGCEVEFMGNGTLCMTENIAKLFDYIIVPSTHYTITSGGSASDNNGVIADYMISHIKKIAGHDLKDYFTAIAHPFSPNLSDPETCELILKEISNQEFIDCFTLAKEAGIAIEINPLIFYHDICDLNFVKNSEYIRMWRIAKEVGCKFTIGSDAHAPTQEFYSSLVYINLIMDICGITQSNLLNLNVDFNLISKEGKVTVNWDNILKNKFTVVIAFYTEANQLIDCKLYNYDKSSSDNLRRLSYDIPNESKVIKAFSLDKLSNIN